MGFVYCPNCSKRVSDQAKIDACPECYHPFNKKVWSYKSNEQKQKDIRDEKERKDKEQQDAQSKKWVDEGLSPCCGGKIFGDDCYGRMCSKCHNYVYLSMYKHL